MLDDDEYLIVDGNVDPRPVETISSLVRSRDDIELLAVPVMPGPQTGRAVRQCRTLKSRFPHLPILWGGYFPSMHTHVVLESSFVDFVIRGQGEYSLLEFLAARRNGDQLEGIPGLSEPEVVV